MSEDRLHRRELYAMAAASEAKPRGGWSTLMFGNPFRHDAVNGLFAFGLLHLIVNFRLILITPTRLSRFHFFYIPLHHPAGAILAK